MLSLINDVLDLSKIEAGKMGLHLETFDVPLVIEEMVTTLQPAAAKNANSIHVHLAENVNTMRADVTKVRQILFNLLSNACKFTDHGTISVDVDQIKVDQRDWIQFRVSDTGIGISAKQKEESVSGVCPGGCLDCTQVWWDRPGTCHYSPVCSVDERAN